MKIRNIFAAFALGLMAMVTLGTVGCAKDTKGEDRLIHDTISKTDTIGRFNISKTVVDQVGGRIEIAFTPDADWTFFSTTPWLTIITERGTKTDRLLVFDVEKNTDIEARVANTILTVNGVKYPLTIHQNAGSRQILVFDMITDFSDDNKTITISNIVANVEVAIKSIPEWMESAVLDKDDNGFYFIVATMKSDVFDSGVLKGDIVIKDMNSDFEVSIPVASQPTGLAFRVGDVSMFEEAFPAVSVVQGDMSREFNVFGSVDAVDPYVYVVAKTMFSAGKFTISDEIVNYASFEKVNSVVPTAAYQEVKWKMTMEPYYDLAANTTRYGSVFLVKQSEVPIFKASKNAEKMLYRVSQKSELGLVQGSRSVLMDWTKAATYSITVTALDLLGNPSSLVTTNYVKYVESGPYLGTADVVPSNVVTPSATKGSGWSDYTFTMTNTLEDNSGYPANNTLPTFKNTISFADNSATVAYDMSFTGYTLASFITIEDPLSPGNFIKDNNIKFQAVQNKLGGVSNDYSFLVRNGIKVEEMTFAIESYSAVKATAEAISVGEADQIQVGMSKATIRLTLTAPITGTILSSHKCKILLKGGLSLQPGFILLK